MYHLSIQLPLKAEQGCPPNPHHLEVKHVAATESMLQPYSILCTRAYIFLHEKRGGGGQGEGCVLLGELPDIVAYLLVIK